MLAAGSESNCWDSESISIYYINSKLCATVRMTAVAQQLAWPDEVKFFLSRYCLCKLPGLEGTPKMPRIILHYITVRFADQGFFFIGKFDIFKTRRTFAQRGHRSGIGRAHLMS